MVHYLLHEQSGFYLTDSLLFFTVSEERGASANIAIYFRRVSSQPCTGAQAGLVPPHEVLALASGQAAVRAALPVAGSPVRAEGEAEASRAVADLEKAVGAKEGLSFAPSLVVDCLQVVVHCTVVQLLPPLQPPPPPPKEHDARHQDQRQHSQDAGDGEGG